VKDHPLFARAWDWIVRLGGKQEMEHRAQLVAGSRGRVLEFGAGTGLNLELYPEDARVVAMEPEPTMARRARERARRSRASVRVLRGSAEALPFADDTFDTAVACYVFCTIPDPLLGASEVRRVLRPQGRLLLYEHVRSEHPRWALWQDRFTPPWRFFGAGCHPNRDTLATLRAAGFDLEVRSFSLGPPSPVRPHVFGVGTAR
jgi:SAM-dependent methyltransferase